MTALVAYLRRSLLPQVNVGNAAWLLHRLTGLALAVYLLPHFVSINGSRAGPAAFDAGLAVFTAPLYKAAEWLLIGTVAFHGFNGLRVIAIDFFALSGRQKLLFWLVMAATAAVLLAASLLFVPRILAPA
ncbi:MAG: succinate dehydrogenase, cytochrome b556 subunit [Candidatus Lambdaproteobacteria bacterium]|nr:succinate dehydrogenase, cytochrome b556 subunit [Candidatus Lambdaproteobacteria bacterium]